MSLVSNLETKAVWDKHKDSHYPNQSKLQKLQAMGALIS